MGRVERLTQLAVLAAVVCLPAIASAGSPFLVVPNAERAEASPAYRYANMSDAEAIAELDRRGIAYTREAEVIGVRTPIRLAGPLRGVQIHSTLPVEKRAHSPFEILDARLALALDDFCVILAEHDVEEILHYTMYRPNVPHPEDTRSMRGSGKADRKRGGEGTTVRDRGGDKARPEAPRDGRRRPTTGKHSGGTSGLDDKASLRDKEPVRKNTAPKKQKPAKVKKATSATSASSAPSTSAAPKKATRAQGTKKATSTKKSSSSTKGRKVVAARTGKRDPVERPRAQWAPEGTRHPAGLAIDVGGLRKRDGSWLSVANDFHGTLGSQTCGVGAPVANIAKAQELRQIVCKAYERGVFTYVLTPNFDEPHADHFHMEIKPGVRWFLYH